MSARIYSVFLSLYPADLRRDFGEEMTQVFLEDLENSRRRRGLFGAAQVWWRSVRELCRIVLPLEVSRREVAVPVLAFFVQEFFCAGLLLLSPFDPSMPVMHREAMALTVVPGLFTASVAFVAMRMTVERDPVSLELGHK